MMRYTDAACVFEKKHITPRGSSRLTPEKWTHNMEMISSSNYLPKWQYFTNLDVCRIGGYPFRSYIFGGPGPLRLLGRHLDVPGFVRIDGFFQLLLNGVITY